MADAAKLRHINTALVRDALRLGGVMSKNDLSRATGLSFPTVSRTVDKLVEAGELDAEGMGESTGGRCAQRYALDPRFHLLLCLRLEGEVLRFSIRDLAGEVLEASEQSCQGGVIQTLDTLLACVRVRYPRLSAVSMGLDGTVCHGTVVETRGHDELRGVNLSAHLQQASALPCVAARDMHIVSTGCWARRDDKPAVLVCIYLGSAGMGASLVLEGKAFGGADAFAGELHYLPIKNNLEYARTNFAGADMTAYYMQVIRAYAALVNPECVVLYDHPLLAGKFERIRRACEQTLSRAAMPGLELSGAFDEDYEAGLFALARRRLREKTE